jgi:uncharacterized protein (TIGR02611 family)
MAAMAAEERRSDEDDDRPELLVKLQERKARHKQRGYVQRVGVVVLGVLLILVGIVMSGPGVPGPGFAVVLLGISFLALEFDRAERFLEKVIIWGDAVTLRVANTSTRVKVAASVLGALAAVAFVVAAVLWDIPLMPVL